MFYSSLILLSPLTKTVDDMKIFFVDIEKITVVGIPKKLLIKYTDESDIEFDCEFSYFM
jgi:hypothetical protein